MYYACPRLPSPDPVELEAMAHWQKSPGFPVPGGVMTGGTMMVSLSQVKLNP